MKNSNKIIYWIATSLLAIGMLQSGIFSIIHSNDWVDLVTSLGYPVYLLTILGIWKILGVIAILVPKFPIIKEWAYAGFLFAMTGALISHISIGDLTIKSIAGPSFQILFIVLSWYFRPDERRVNNTTKE